MCLLLKTSHFNEDFIKNYNEDSDIEHLFAVDVHFPKKFHDFHNILTFVPKRMKNEKPLANLLYKKVNTHAHKSLKH